MPRRAAARPPHRGAASTAWIPRLALAALVASALAGVVLAQQAPATPPAESAGESEAAPGFEPLLPTEGLLRPETWVELARGLLERLVNYLPSLVAAVLVLLLFLLFSRAVVRLAARALHRSRVDPALGQIALPLLRYTILGLGIIMAAAQAGLEVGSLLAGVGVAGIAVGLAAQDSLGNIFAGLTILWDRPFRIGDKVTIADTYGEVMHIGLRSTRLRTLEQLDVILPNREVINQTIHNHTLSPNLRLGVPLSIAYKEDSRRARQVLVAAVAGHERILAEPAPEVVVTALAESGVELELRVWLKDPQHERASLYAVLECAKIALDEAGIEIPFPQRTLHIAPGTAPLPLTGGDGDAAVSPLV